MPKLTPNHRTRQSQSTALDLDDTGVATRATTETAQPQSPYVQLTEDELEDMEDRCKSRSGYVCLIRDKGDSEWVKLQQTPYLGLLQSWLDRISRVRQQEIVRSWRHDDRFEALDAARAKLSNVAEARQTHADGISEFFKVTIEAAIEALETA